MKGFVYCSSKLIFLFSLEKHETFKTVRLDETTTKLTRSTDVNAGYRYRNTFFLYTFKQ